MRWLAITMFCACCGACTTPSAPDMNRMKSAYSPATLHRVHASVRVDSGKKNEKRAGQYVVGKPYVVKGKRYYPKEEPSYDRSGVASWYGRVFQGRRTANGETYDAGRLSAAHPTLPLPSYVRVTNLENGSSVILRVNDRGPYHEGRAIDVSSKAAEMLDLKRRGTASVRVQYLGRAALGGDDMAFLMASLRQKERGAPGINRPIGLQVAGNSNGKYVERRAPFVEANSVGSTSVAFGLRGGKLTLTPRPFELRASEFVGKASRLSEAAIHPECCLSKERVADGYVLQAFLPSAFERKSRLTGITGGRRPRQVGNRQGDLT
jgi:rare lipoprotein A (peptidoglycan hydrolase)